MYALLEPEMWDLINIVTPKVKAYWQNLAYSMSYNAYDVKAMERDGKDSSEQCRILFENWLTGQSSCTPKTWKTLLECIKAVGALSAAAIHVDIENVLSDKNKQCI